MCAEIYNTELALSQELSNFVGVRKFLDASNKSQKLKPILSFIFFWEVELSRLIFRKQDLNHIELCLTILKGLGRLGGDESSFQAVKDVRFFLVAADLGAVKVVTFYRDSVALHRIVSRLDVAHTFFEDIVIVVERWLKLTFLS